MENLQNNNYAVDKKLLSATQNQVRSAVLRRFSPIEGVGIDLRNAQNYQEAMTLSGLGFIPQQEKIATVSNQREITGYKALFNSITQEQLSVVKNEYTVISNDEAFTTAEDLIAYEGFKFETSNTQKGGARSRLILSGPSVFIQGEEFTPYAVFNNSFDLSKSVCIQFMFMRLSCLNGLMRKAPQCNSTIALSHFGQKETKLKRLTQFRNNFSATLAYLQREAAVLQSTKLTREEFKKEIIPFIVAHTFQRPINTPLTAQQQTRTEAYITSILQAYDAVDTQNFNNTAFKVQLALSDVDSHLAPFVNRNRPDLYLDRILQSGTVLSTANAATNYMIHQLGLKI